jgi:hypothetical protein
VVIFGARHGDRWSAGVHRFLDDVLPLNTALVV